MIAVTKTYHGLVPADNETSEWYEKIKMGETVRWPSPPKKMRNVAFHRKLFALLNLAYEYWEPQEIDTKWGKPAKNFDTFRKNLTVLAGYGHPVFNIDGSFKMEPDSISFGKMSQDDFDKLYSAILDKILERIPVLCKMDRDEVNELVDKVIQFG